MPTGYPKDLLGEMTPKQVWRKESGCEGVTISGCLGHRVLGCAVTDDFRKSGCGPGCQPGSVDANH